MSASRRDLNRFIIISIFRRAGSAGERFSAHFLCEEHFSLREKGVGDMRVRLYIHSN
jgi:hypothetical protein